MKKMFLMAGMILLAAACSNESENQVINNLADEAQVRVQVKGFDVSQEDFPMTRTDPQDVSDYDGVKAVTLAFYSGEETEVYKVTQLRSDATTYSTFGEFSLSLPLGSYTMVVLGYALYDDDALTLTSPSEAEVTMGGVRETFAATQAVNITSTNSVNLSATLSRIVAQLKVNSTDNRTDDVSKVRMTFSAGGKRFSPTSGLATLNNGFSSTVSISTAVGVRSGSIGYLFLATDEQTMDVTIETLNADGDAIFTKVVKNVPFKRNRKTKLSGAIYTVAAASTSFTLDTDWIADTNVNF